MRFLVRDQAGARLPNVAPAAFADTTHAAGVKMRCACISIIARQTSQHNKPLEQTRARTKQIRHPQVSQLQELRAAARRISESRANPPVAVFCVCHPLTRRWQQAQFFKTVPRQFRVSAGVPSPGVVHVTGPRNLAAACQSGLHVGRSASLLGSEACREAPAEAT